MPLLLFDFTDPQATAGWRAVDDRVMGGLSRSRLRSDPAGHAVFEGEVSLAQNGGFASVQSSPAELGHAGASACVIEVRSEMQSAMRGAPKQFKLSLVTWDGASPLNYQAGFACTGAEWQALHLPLAAFRASFRGREVPGAPPLDPARLRQVGLVIAARQEGAFALCLRRISLV